MSVKSALNPLKLTKPLAWAFKKFAIKQTDLTQAQVAVIFGCGIVSLVVAKQAAKDIHLHKKLYGSFPDKVIVTGGVERWHFQAKERATEFGFKKHLGSHRLTESQFMKQELVRNGIPKDIIVEDREATNTGENVVNSDALGMKDAESLMFFGIAYHMRRQAETFAAQSKNDKDPVIALRPAYPKQMQEKTWHKSPLAWGFVLAEMKSLLTYRKAGYTAPFNFERNEEVLKDKNFVENLYRLSPEHRKLTPSRWS